MLEPIPDIVEFRSSFCTKNWLFHPSTLLCCDVSSGQKKPSPKTGKRHPEKPYFGTKGTPRDAYELLTSLKNLVDSSSSNHESRRIALVSCTFISNLVWEKDFKVSVLGCTYNISPFILRRVPTFSFSTSESPISTWSARRFHWPVCSIFILLVM